MASVSTIIRYYGNFHSFGNTYTTNRIRLKVLNPTFLYINEYFQMVPAVSIYAHEYPTTSKYHMLPTNLGGEIST